MGMLVELIGLICLFVFFFTAFSGSLSVVINHAWHLLWHIYVLKFHDWVSHTAWCGRFSLYLHHHSPAEYKMNRGSSPRLRRSCISGMFSHSALMTGSDKPVYTLQGSLPASSPALAATVLVSFVWLCLWVIAQFVPHERRRHFLPLCIFTVCLNCWNYL